MAERGRFPVLYWASIFLLLLMLAFTGWWWYRSTIGSCDNLLDDPVTRAYVQRQWREGRITVLLRHTDRCRDGEGQTCVEGLTDKGQADAKRLGQGMTAMLSGKFRLYSDESTGTARLAFGREPKVVSWLGEDCGKDLRQQLWQPHQGDEVMVTHSACLGGLKDAGGEPLIPFNPAGEEDHGLAVFLLRPEQGGLPKVLACVWPEDWVEARRD
jgi:hypothetical protein